MARNPLYSRLPKIWKNLDELGVLQRYLGVMDADLDRVHAKIWELLLTRNVEKIADKFLYLMASMVGHEWRDDKSRLWNRNRIIFAIKRHSYKGTYERLYDEVREAGSSLCEVQDNASRLMVIGKQGCIGTSDCVIMDSRFWHDGSFLLSVDSHTNWDDLSYGMGQTNSAGEVWWVQSVHQPEAIHEVDVSVKRETVRELDNLSYITIGQGIIGSSFWIGYERLGSVSLEQTRGLTGVVGGLLTYESNVIWSDDIIMNEGTATNPLSEENALIQAPPEIDTPN